MCKLRMRPSGYNASAMEVLEGLLMSIKRPSAGLDLIREYLDTMRQSYRYYINGWAQTEDGQLLVQLKRTTEGGLQTGYVLVVDGKIEKMPENELATDCMLPEVLTNFFVVQNARLRRCRRTSLPRTACCRRY